MNLTPAQPQGQLSLMRKLRGPMVASGIVFFLFFGVFGVWAAVVPISSGAIASGVISPDGSRRTVQHLEGGIIAELVVGEGDEVVVGDPLLILEKTQAQVGDDVLAERQRTLQVTVARLQAEQSGRRNISFPPAIEAASEPEIVELRNAQTALFNSRRSARVASREALSKQISQLDAEIEGIEALIATQADQIQITSAEIRSVQELFDDGLASESRLLDLRRRLSQTQGARAENVSRIARARQSINEIELEIVNQRAAFQADVAKDLDAARSELANVTTEKSAASDRLSRTLVSAPIDGRIAELRYKTVGGVIRPGDPILDIVPSNEDLLIEARVSPIDIDSMTVGLDASVQLSAFTSRNLPRIDGRVLAVSPDTLIDDITGERYFQVDVEVDGDQLAELSRTLDTALTLSPGMPAEVLIVTGERTLFEYLWAPLGSSVQQAFREQ